VINTKSKTPHSAAMIYLFVSHMCKLFSVFSSWSQCRIDNSRKCSNCYEPRAFGGPAVLCV